MEYLPISPLGTAANLTAWLTLTNDVATCKAVQLSKDIQHLRDLGTTIYPPQADMFNALSTVHPSSLKCVILGQDPYINEGQAMGLAFSVRNDVTPPPSLSNILQVLQSDDVNATIEGHDLTPWTRQGVMLLNTTLTVKAGVSNSHSQIGWDMFTRSILEATLKLPQPVVYLLWGRHAHRTIDTVTANTDPNAIQNKFGQRASHPSPLGCRHSGTDYVAFMDAKPFSYANRMLSTYGSRPIDWSL